MTSSKNHYSTTYFNLPLSVAEDFTALVVDDHLKLLHLDWVFFVKRRHQCFKFILDGQIGALQCYFCVWAIGQTGRASWHELVTDALHAWERSAPKTILSQLSGGTYLSRFVAWTICGWGLRRIKRDLFLIFFKSCGMIFKIQKISFWNYKWEFRDMHTWKKISV